MADGQETGIHFQNNLERTAVDLRLPGETYANSPPVKDAYLYQDVNHRACRDSI